MAPARTGERNAPGPRLPRPVKGGHRPAQRTLDRARQTHTLRAWRAGGDSRCQPPSPSGGKDYPALGGGARGGGSAVDVRRWSALRHVRWLQRHLALSVHMSRFTPLASRDLLQVRGFTQEHHDVLRQSLVLRAFRCLQRLRDVRPCFERTISVALIAVAGLGLPATLAQTPFLLRLHAP